SRHGYYIHSPGLRRNTVSPVDRYSSAAGPSGRHFADLPDSDHRNRAASLATEMVISVPDWLLRPSTRGELRGRRLCSALACSTRRLADPVEPDRAWARRIDVPANPNASACLDGCSGDGLREGSGVRPASTVAARPVCLLARPYARVARGSEKIRSRPWRSCGARWHLLDV